MASQGAAPSCSTAQSRAESRAAHTASLALHVVGPTIATLAVLLRFWSRALLKKFGWDDYLIAVALSLSIAQSGAAWKFTEASFGGYHFCDVPQMTIPMLRKLKEWLLIQELLYNPILGFVKASVLLFLMRFQDNRPLIRHSLRIFFVVNIALGIAIFLADLFQCTPIRYVYDGISMDLAARIREGADPATGLKPDGSVVNGGRCIKQTAFVLSTAAITTFTEALTLLIPMAMVWNLKIARKKKIAVTSILSLGWIVVAISVVRIVLFSRLLAPNSAAMDASYGAQNAISSIEVNLAIIAACAPALKALTYRLSPRFLSTNTPGSGYKSWGNRSSQYAGGTKESSARHGYGQGSMSGPTHVKAKPIRGSKVYYGNKLGKGALDLSILERESQERIIDENGPQTALEIEKTVRISIELGDMKGRKIGRSVMIE